MTKMLAHWILSALCLLLVAHFVPGFFVRGFGTALIAAVVIGLVNGTIGAHSEDSYVSPHRPYLRDILAAD